MADTQENVGQGDFALRRLGLKLFQQRVIGRVAALPYRFYSSWHHLKHPLRSWAKWLLTSREITNWTYDLTERNLNYLAAFCAHVTDKPREEINTYIAELIYDRHLHEHILAVLTAEPAGTIADRQIRFGRRIGWYVFARAVKPQVVVETGLDKGLGAVVLCAALLRNRVGRYYGFELHPDQGYLLSGTYASVGSIIYGDAIESLKRFDKQIDLYVNDSDHTAGYEAAELELVGSMLSSNALVLGDNADDSDELLKFASRTHRHFLYFQEQPRDHWYPGAGIGVAFRKRPG